MNETALLWTQRAGETAEVEDDETYVPRNHLALPLLNGIRTPKESARSNELYPVTGDILLRMTYHRCILTLQIQKGRNLKPPNKPGYTNPYCRAQVVPEQAELKCRTRCIQHDLNPKWMETFPFSGIDPREIHHKKIAISVWHRNWLWPDTLLGEVIVDLADPVNLDGVRRWYQLE
ncbi:protein piccolo-like [Paramacrobiotus metropolitanus]|uniref:protein piccolo-like n=1 Tax=Paramacrobiotus metropolitanus TaxID=2943436 RepID=UPI002446405B|nr:protein piccolo-like [Paramacrobiotus metropolitanus]